MNNAKWFFILLCSCFSFLFCFSSLASEVIEAETTKPKLERHFVFDTAPMNLEEITKAAGKIFTGVCTDIEEIENDSEANLPVIKYKFKITENIKGVREKEEIAFKQWQPTVKGTGYEMGKKYILFLYPESDRGLTSPVGLSQGLFKIEKKGFINVKEVVKNGVSNRGLNRNLRTQKKISIEKDRYVNDYVHRCSELGIPMRYKEFIQAVKYLAEKE